MKNYERPIVTINEGLAEGVYAASGCYEVSISSHQAPEGARLTHVFQFNGIHNSIPQDGHSGSAQVLNVVFDKPVDFISASGTYLDGTGTTTIRISYAYTQNPEDKIGLGDLVVAVVGDAADTQLEIESLWLDCNGLKTW